MIYCNCGGPYMIRDGELVCVKCDGLSPKKKWNHKAQRFETVTDADRARVEQDKRKMKAAR